MNGEQNGMTDESVILDHVESPYHRGRVANATCTGAERNPGCGDWVRLQLVIGSHGRIDQAWFEAQGCLVSRAAASILCQTTASRLVALPAVAAVPARAGLRALRGHRLVPSVQL